MIFTRAKYHTFKLNKRIYVSVQFIHLFTIYDDIVVLNCFFVTKLFQTCPKLLSAVSKTVKGAHSSSLITKCVMRCFPCILCITTITVIIVIDIFLAPISEFMAFTNSIQGGRGGR